MWSLVYQAMTPLFPVNSKIWVQGKKNGDEKVKKDCKWKLFHHSQTKHKYTLNAKKSRITGWANSWSIEMAEPLACYVYGHQPLTEYPSCNRKYRNYLKIYTAPAFRELTPTYRTEMVLKCRYFYRIKTDGVRSQRLGSIQGRTEEVTNS